MPKNGDKKKSPQGRRVERVTLLLSEHEKEALETHAQEIGVSTTAAVRLLLAQKVPGFKEPR